ncbi:MAG: class I SAM-dependent methyltransferase [Cyclobacteriaceae bacterium]|nr:class I SAM-dependent methyltransferase [Cyclobacteriaceae bacterium]
MNSPSVPHSRQLSLGYFENCVTHNEIKGKQVYDLSAGSGYIINLFLQQGAQVHPYDLFPGQNRFCPVPCKSIDLQQKFPIESEAAEIVICSETIGCLPDQNFFFEEVSRILKPGGRLLLTLPNTSSLRSRFSQFLGESEHYSIALPNEHTAYVLWNETDKGYFREIFISGILRLRALAALHGLKIDQVVPTRYSSTSYLLMFTYPLIYYFARKNYRRELRAHPEQAETLQEIFELTTSTQVLLSKHLIIEFIKK